ncbi:phosphatidylinositide phosphatase SAC2-like isoform X2 [Ptychodera flava]|uniref:phosphatidylinositide phosphatase SAC2-like isoform X2 n=1 Tax=Ptychodera flava TaxID=63121 RepID=UPI00396A9699
MELFQAHDHYIIQDGEYSLWCNRFDGRLTPRSGSDLCSAWNPVCLGQVEGVIGKIQIHPESDWKLLLIRQRTPVGCLPDDSQVYCINKIAVLPLSLNEPIDFEIELCKKHHFGISKPEKLVSSQDGQQKALIKTWNSIKSVTGKGKKKETKDREKLERRVLEELHKMFSDHDSFYYSPTGDLTNSIQRQYHNKTSSSSHRKTNERFFWNKYMIQDILDAKDRSQADHWIVPIIQGYVQIEQCKLDFTEDKTTPEEELPFFKEPLDFTLTLISRRSRHRAGTRYKRRGVDETGACANYVETEQILSIPNHTVSFVLVRGSVPVYWSQPGYKYRPPPRLDKGEEETEKAFRAHFDSELKIYKTMALINLVDQSGREQIIGDAYVHYILNYNSPLLTYVSFDFHEYCRGMKFENVSVLTESIKDIIKEMRYCWVDRKGIICEQEGVFRVNCMDCLDRTNVVETAIARVVLDTQFRKLGMLVPDSVMTPSVRAIYQQMWANNGDAISRQYAGTVALKGDFTRTGERKFTGVMKDGYNSANRYIQNRFKDAYRQVVIDLMQGNPVTEDLSILNATKSPETEEDVWILEKDDSVNQLIQHCKKLLLPQNEECFGGWALIDCDPPDSTDITQQDMDVILLLTQRAYYIANYSDEAEKVTHYQRIPIEDLEMIEIGETELHFEQLFICPEPSIFKSKFTCLRIRHLYGKETGFFHTLRALPSKTEKEAKDIFHTVTEAFATARAANSLGLKVVDGKLERKKSKPHEEIISISSQTRLSAWLRETLTREMVPKKASRQGQGQQPRATGTIAVVPRMSKARDQAKAYVGNVKNKISSFNPMRKIKLKRSGNSSEGPQVRYQKGMTPQDSTDSKDSIELDDYTVKDSTSSSDTEGYDVIESSDVIDDDACALSEHSNDDDTRDFVDREIDTEDNDFLLSSCGILATSPRRNSLSLSLHNFEDVSDIAEDIPLSEYDEIRRSLRDKAMERLDREISESPEVRDLAESIQISRSAEVTPGVQGKPLISFTLESDDDDKDGREVESATSLETNVASSGISNSISLTSENEEIPEEIQGSSASSITEPTSEEKFETASSVSNGDGTLFANGVTDLPDIIQDTDGNGPVAPEIMISSTSPVVDVNSTEGMNHQDTAQPSRSPPVKSHSENSLAEYARKIAAVMKNESKTSQKSEVSEDLESNNSSNKSSPTASPMTRIRHHITNINIPMIRKGNRRERQVRSMVSLEMRLRSKNCLTKFIQL